MTQDNLFDNAKNPQEKPAPPERIYSEGQTKKWSFGISSRKVEKELSNGLNDLKWLMRTSIDVYGVVGGKESRCRSNILVGPVCNHAALKEYIELGEKYEWMVLPSNADAIRVDLSAAFKKAEAGLPINDHRETQETAQQRAIEEKARHEACAQNDAEMTNLWEALKAKAPARAQAVVFGELHESECDLQTDYFDSKRIRLVAIGFRTGSREDFRQLRKAAACFPETAHMGPGQDIQIAHLYYQGNILGPDHSKPSKTLSACTLDELNVLIEVEKKGHFSDEWDGATLKIDYRTQSYEHRDNYSMGKGNYLAEARYSGWHVFSYSLDAKIPPNVFEDATGPFLNGNGETEASPSTSEEATITYNERFNGIEVKFPGTFDDKIKGMLQLAGFRWHRKKELWYAKKSGKTETTAKAATLLYKQGVRPAA